MHARTRWTFQVVGVVLAVLIPGLIGAGILLRDDANKYFGEGKPGTIASVVFLFLAGLLALKLYRQMRPLVHARLWCVLGVLFVFTALDDMFKGHENLDYVIAEWFGLDPEGPADHIDDVLVAMYLLPAAVVAMTWGRSYFLRLRWTAWFFGAAVGAFGVMVSLDFFGDFDWLEESSKLVAAGLIFVAVAAGEHSPLTDRLSERARRMRSARLCSPGDAGAEED